ncbi:MAG: T9SS C-terminal target domain-containing protein [Maribacter sp.]|nr:T9SS C-terminal target domain-containing protein [Maribacter sp.]
MKARFLNGILFLISSFIWSQGVMEKGPLPKAVSETSGLIFYNGHLITHNDSGNSAQLYEIDTLTLKIVRTVTILNAENIDWEDVDQDEHFIYIGDIGNNSGIRQNLAIYRIRKIEYDRSDAVMAEKIEFKYEDQTDFAKKGFSDWDAESLFIIDGQLVILTKQWQNNRTVAYTIPNSPGSYIAKKLDSLSNLGMITGATYNSSTHLLYLIGYSRFLIPFLVRVKDPTPKSIFAGSISRTDLEIGFVQAEGIAYVSADHYFFSSEFFKRIRPAITSESRLFSFWVDADGSVQDAPADN